VSNAGWRTRERVCILLHMRPREGRPRDGSRLVHRGLLIALFLLLGMGLVARGVTIVVDAHTLNRDGLVADAIVLRYAHTVYGGASGRVYIGDPVYRDVPAQALRPHDSGDRIRVRYLAGLAREDGAPLNYDAIVVWVLLGLAVLGFAGWFGRALYREQLEWERLEAQLFAPGENAM
jgi:hypothetical protein